MDLLKNKQLLKKVVRMIFEDSDARIYDKDFVRRIIIEKQYVTGQPAQKYNFSEDIKKAKYKWLGKNYLFEKGNEMANDDGWNGDFCHVATRGAFPMTVKHRIYINPAPQDRYEFIDLFMKKCDEHGVKYYFKYSRRDTTRLDTFLIYASDEQLNEYQKILAEIEKERPDMISRMGETVPSASSHGWWAYGPEKVKGSSLTTEVASEIRNATKYAIIQLKNQMRGDELRVFQQIDRFLSRCILKNTDSKKQIYLDEISDNDIQRIKNTILYHSDEVMNAIFNKDISINDVKRNRFDESKHFRIKVGEYFVEVTPEAICEFVLDNYYNHLPQSEKDRIIENACETTDRLLNKTSFVEDLPMQNVKGPTIVNNNNRRNTF